MGFVFTFGELEVTTDEGVTWSSAALPDAEGPWNSAQNKSAEIGPSYTVWSDFARRWGLYKLFFDKRDGLVAHHPGAAAVTEEHAQAFEAALARYIEITGVTLEELERRSQVDQARLAQIAEAYKRAREEGRTRAEAAKVEARLELEHEDMLTRTYYDGLRLRWLAYWSRWVLEHCERPTLGNS